MSFIIQGLIFLGSALMVYNIIRYNGFLKHVNKMESIGKIRRIAVIPLILLSGFLAGYLIVGVLGKPDIVMALILFGGSVYVSLVLLFLYRIVDQLEKNENHLRALYTELQGNLNDLTRDALSVYRVNLTKDTIDECGGAGISEGDLDVQSYSELVEMRKKHILLKDPGMMGYLLSRDGLLRYYQDGHTALERILFCENTSGQSCFIKLQMSFAKQPNTGDTVAFITEKICNNEIVSETLQNKALADQYDMIAYLVDGRCNVVVGDRNRDRAIFPESNEGSYEEYIAKKVVPLLCGTQEERADAATALIMEEVEQQLAESEPYGVNITCQINGEICYKRFIFYTVDRRAKFYVLMISDMTDARREEHEQNERLQAALEDARRASAAKSMFLFNMSHDIRTPMNAIIGYTNLAQRKDNDLETVRDYLDKIDASNQYLLALINDVLEMSRIESDKVKLEPVPIDLRDLLDEVRDMFTTQMSEKGITFEVSYDDIKNAHVLCDKNRVNRILMNLLSNAYKFTPEDGAITVSLRQEDGAKEKFGNYELRVRDNGIGMSEEFAARVFDAFERERSSTESGIQGTGLGMAITKSFVDLMGGSIRVETAPGEGTEFIIRLSLPLGEGGEESEERLSRRSLEEGKEIDYSRIRLLLVEDNMVNRDIAAFILGDMGFMVDTAENGKLALEQVEASEPGYYGLILMDIQMPVMNGYESARRIRDLSDPVLSRIPIIAMTANAFAEDIKEAENAGMNDHIAKPLDVPSMKKTIKKVLLKAQEEEGKKPH